jgi:hypothetical protein
VYLTSSRPTLMGQSVLMVMLLTQPDRTGILAQGSAGVVMTLHLILMKTSCDPYACACVSVYVSLYLFLLLHNKHLPPLHTEGSHNCIFNREKKHTEHRKPIGGEQQPQMKRKHMAHAYSLNTVPVNYSGWRRPMASRRSRARAN